MFTKKKDVKFSSRAILKLLKEMDGDIKKVIDARDKVYAHTDPDVSVPNVSLEELEAFCKTAAKWYNVVFGRFFGVTFLFQGTIAWDIDYPLKGLSEVIERRVS